MKIPEVYCLRDPAVKRFYMDHLNNLRAKTTQNYLRHLNAWVAFMVDRAGCEPEEIDYGVCTLVTVGTQNSMTQLHETTVNEYMRNCNYSSRESWKHLIVFFEWLVRTGVLTRMPIGKPPKVKPRRVKHALCESDLEAFASVLLCKPIYMRAPISILLATGIRVSSLCALEKFSVREVSKGRWIITVPPIKKSQAAELPLADVSEIMQEYHRYRAALAPDHNQLFVSTRGTPLKPATVRTWISKICMVSGCSVQVRPHDFRRVVATIYANTDGIEVARRILVHKREDTTLRYVAPPEIKELSNELSRLPSMRIASEFSSNDVVSFPDREL